MAKGKSGFGSTWANQTDLGRRFGMTAIAFGRKLSELGLRGDDKNPTKRALDEGYAKLTPMRDGRPFYRWHVEKVTALLRESGLATVSRDEQEARQIANKLRSIQRQANERPGVEKELSLMWDATPERLIPLVRRYLEDAKP